MENGSPELPKDNRKTLWPFLDSRKCRAKFTEQFHPEAGPLAVVPGGRFERFEFRLRPDLQSRHLPAAAEALLHPSDDLFPGTSLVGRSAMCGETLLQHGLLPFLQRDLTDRRGDAIPERLHVVDLFFDRERVESRAAAWAGGAASSRYTTGPTRRGRCQRVQKGVVYSAGRAIMNRRSTRTPTRGPSLRPQARAASALASFLEQPDRPPGTLRYHELQGFLFAVASAPELVRPSEWMPIVFGGKEAGFQSLDEAQTILPELMTLYNAVNASVAAERATLPPDCRFRRKALANLNEDAPISLWSRGFLRGHQWLEEDWDPYVPDDFDHDFAALLLTLSFFASKTLAAAYLTELGHVDLDAMATRIRRAFPDALAEYARLGRSIHKTLIEHGAAAGPRTRPRVGRNDPWPCGSGRKYKKCCGATVAG